MNEKSITVIGDFIDMKHSVIYDFSSTVRLRAKLINKERLWESKDRSAEFMGAIWGLFLDQEKEHRIKTVLHAVCVELIENSLKYGIEGDDYIITVNLCLKDDELQVYTENKTEPSHIPGLETAARMALDTENIMILFKQKMKEAKAAKKLGQTRSQLGFIRIMMQDVKLAWQIKTGTETVVTTLARIPLTKKDR